MESFLLKKRKEPDAFLSINFAIISKMFYLSISCQSDSRPQNIRSCAYLHGTDYEPAARIPQAGFLESKIFHLFYKIEKSVPALKAAVQEIMKEIYKEGLTFKSQVNAVTIPLNSIIAGSSLGRCGL